MHPAECFRLEDHSFGAGHDRWHRTKPRRVQVRGWFEQRQYRHDVARFENSSRRACALVRIEQRTGAYCY